MPFVEKHNPSFCLRYIENPDGCIKQASIDFVLKMCNGGLKGPMKTKGGDASEEEKRKAWELLEQIHPKVKLKTCGLTDRKLRAIGFTYEVPGTGNPGRGHKIDKVGKMKKAIALCPYFFNVDGDTLCKLDVDWQKMKPLPDALDTTVGTLCEFGDIWTIKSTLAERLWDDQEEPPINLALEQAAPGDQNKDAIGDMANYHCCRLRFLKVF